MPSVTPSDGPVAVTGASGYVGSHVVLTLVKHGFTVHACSFARRFPYSSHGSHAKTGYYYQERIS